MTVPVVVQHEEEVPLDNIFKQLNLDIETKREALHTLMKVYQDLSHPKILALSQELDQLINKVNELKKEDDLTPS